MTGLKTQDIYQQPWNETRPDFQDPTYDLIKVKATSDLTSNVNVVDLRRSASSALLYREYSWNKLFALPDLQRKVNVDVIGYYDSHKLNVMISRLIFMPEKLMKNVCLAGGAVSSLILKGYVDEDQDYDLFIYGQCDPYKIAKKLRKYLLKTFDLKFAERKANVTSLFLTHGRKETLYKVQIINKHYLSPSEIISTFDLSSCKVCLYQGDIYATKDAVESFRNMKNTVNIKNRSWSYEYRLAKYGQRGFAVELPSDISLDSVSRARETALQYSLMREEEKEKLKISPLVNLLIMEAVVKNKGSLFPFAASSYDQSKKEGKTFFEMSDYDQKTGEYQALKSFETSSYDKNKGGLKDFETSSYDKVNNSNLVTSYTTNNPYRIWKVSRSYLEHLGQLTKDSVFTVSLKVIFPKSSAFQRDNMSLNDWSSPKFTPSPLATKLKVGSALPHNADCD